MMCACAKLALDRGLQQTVLSSLGVALVFMR